MIDAMVLETNKTSHEKSDESFYGTTTVSTTEYGFMTQSFQSSAISNNIIEF